jgi:hypothetical protein
VAAFLAATAISMPVALLSGQAATAASATTATTKRVAQPAGSVAITITSMTPRQAAPGSTITVSGALQNVSQQPIGPLAVRLLGSGTRITDVAQLQPGASEAYGLAGMPVSGASSMTTGQLNPGGIKPWSIHFKASAIGMSAFGVYPLTAEARSALTGDSVAMSTTYLPYVPAKKGPDGSTIPARTKISWVWPLIDAPLLSRPAQDVCQDPQAKALAASLASDGRLGQIVEAGSSGARTAITWAVDPALLTNVQTLGECGGSEPKMAAAARNWLEGLRQRSSGQPLFFTPYGDPNVAALIGARHGDDVQRAFQYGRRVGGAVLKRTITQTASIAWPPGGIPGDAGAGNPGYRALQYLAAYGIQTLLLGSSYLPTKHVAVLRAPNGSCRTSCYMNILLASKSLTRLLGPGSTGESAFATSQQFLAETALLTQENHGQPIVVSPPQRWAPAPHLAEYLLAVTGSASWLSPVSLASLTAAKNLPTLTQSELPQGPSSAKLNRSEIRVLKRVDDKIAQLDVLRAAPDLANYLAVAAAESSAWHGKSKAPLDALRALEQRIRQQLSHGVQIEAEQRFTLGGLKGSVPVSIDNTLSYPVKVRLWIGSDPSSGLKIALSPGPVVKGNGLITIPPRNVVTVHLRVQAAHVGATAVTLRLENNNQQALPNNPALRMTIQATQVGVLGVIIFAVALGIFLIATAARAARRGRPAAATEQATEPVSASEQADDGPARLPEPDTVMAERTELGATGTPGRD